MVSSNGAAVPPPDYWDSLRKLRDHEAALSILWHALRLGTEKLDAPESADDYGARAASGSLHATIEYLERFPDFIEVLRPLKSLEFALNHVRDGQRHEMLTPKTDGVGHGSSLRAVEVGIRRHAVHAMRLLVHSGHFTKQQAFPEVLARFTKAGIRFRGRHLKIPQLRDWYDAATERGKNHDDWKTLVPVAWDLKPRPKAVALLRVDNLARSARENIQGPVPD